MTAGTIVTLIVVTVVLIAAVVVAYSIAVRTKRSLESPATPLAPHAAVTVPLSETSAASLAHLSREPILLKQSTTGVRVQLDNRPLVPLAILTDTAAAAALREIVARASREYGAQWTVLVTPAETMAPGASGTINLRRLA